jgi:hypothetical protein
MVGRGVEVLFSVANAAELSGPKDGSFEKMRAFLNEVGPFWFPVELHPQPCIARERQAKDPAACCFSEDLLRAFTASRLNRHPATRVVDRSTDFFQLGLFMEWFGPQRDEISASKAEMDRSLIKQIQEHRAKYEDDRAWLNANFPEVSFRPERPATFAYVNLVRNMILDAKSYKLMPGDGMDFCQAVIGAAYASVATLDKHWKRRVEALPKPNKLAKVYCSPHLDAMVDEIEQNVEVLKRRGGRVAFARPGDQLMPS